MSAPVFCDNLTAHLQPSREANSASAPPQTNVDEPLRRRQWDESGIRKVLVATDFSPASAKAVELAATVASQCDATLTILHVVDINAQAVSGHLGMADEAMNALWAEGFSKMAQIACSLPGRARAQSTINEGLPWEEIASQSREFDLLVLGSHGKANGKLFSPHAGRRILENSACPVLVVS